MHEATVCRIVRKVENALIQAGIFQLPGKKQLLDPESVAALVVVDATETPIERPKKGLSSFPTVGKKSDIPSKLKLVVDPKTKAVICTTFATEKEHDFHLFKRSRVKLKKETRCLVDKGYQGIHKLHSNSQLPTKKPLGKPLSQLDRQMNQNLERTRGICERVIGSFVGV